MKFLIILSSLAVAMAAIIPHKEADNQIPQYPEPKRCCLPPTFQMNAMGTIYMNDTDKWFNNKIQFDVIHAMMSKQGLAAMQSTSYENGRLQPKISRMVFDYNHLILYAIMDGNCVKSSIPEAPIEMCISEKATYVGNSYFKRNTMLKNGKAKLLVNNWLQKFEFEIEDNSSVLLELEASLTTKCTPVKIDHTINTKEVYTKTSMVSTSFVDHIQDPSIFEIPKHCENVTQELPSRQPRIIEAIFMMF